MVSCWKVSGKKAFAMPSMSYHTWASSRAIALDEIGAAHAAVGGSARGRRYATQQINRAYAVLLASHFQGFCRDLHSECVDYIVSTLVPASLRPIVQAELTLNRQLDSKNAQPGSIGSDFGRLGITFWPLVKTLKPANATRKTTLDLINVWRNGIVHQNLVAARLGGTTTLRLATVKRWRKDCGYLAESFDAVMRVYIHSLTGSYPWVK